MLALAPDAGAAAAGRKLGNPGAWKNLGRDAGAVWGECQGSALYQVKADLADLAASCSCPSRKFPCKHGLGLLLLVAAGQVEVADPPPWVLVWREKRAQAAEKKLARQEGGSEAATPPTAPIRTRSAEKRLRQVADGLEHLDLWLRDLARNGLAGLELKPASFWEQQAARLLDTKAPGLAGRVRRLATIPGSGSGWPNRLLDELGRLALLLRAFEGLDDLEPLLQADVRALIGWTLKEDEVAAQGETVRDSWIVLGQWTEEIEDGRAGMRARRSWLHGVATGRAALILQFSVLGRPFAEPILPGTVFEADLSYWPSAAPQRALIRQRHGSPASRIGAFVGAPTLAAFLEGVANSLARNPWLETFPCVLNGVTPTRSAEGTWWVVDRAEQALPLSSGEHWKLLALSGGAPVDLAGEWSGETLRPLSTMVEGAYHLLGEGSV